MPAPYDDIPVQDRRSRTRQGVVTEACTGKIDADGRVVPTSLTERLISIRERQLAAPVAAALATSIVDSLVEDTSTARYLPAAAGTAG